MTVRIVMDVFLSGKGDILGTKEAGFVQAIRVAGMTLQVARKCSLGNVDCGCSLTTHETPDGVLLMEGCPQKVIAAARKVKRFLDSEQRLVADAAHMERHNTFVGINVSTEHLVLDVP